MAPLTTSICRSCRLKMHLHEQARAFSVSARSKNIPPESPRYIDVPPSHQPDQALPYRPKGVLPVPRELFPTKRPDKPSAQYIRNVTMDPLPKNTRSTEGMSEFKRYRMRMTELRKKNLREGLVELHKRKESMGRRIAQRSEDKQTERAGLIAQAERQDARLTNVTTPQAMLDSSVHYSKEQAEEILQRKKANIARHAEKKAEVRRNALHTLYMNARNFITTEEQLKAEIEKEFDENKWISFGSGRDKPRSVWAEGVPLSIKQMLSANDPVQSTGSTDGMARKVTKDQQRMKKIAEVLSGGKM